MLGNLRRQSGCIACRRILVKVSHKEMLAWYMALPVLTRVMQEYEGVLSLHQRPVEHSFP